jgi:hypothetical protein
MGLWPQAVPALLVSEQPLRPESQAPQERRVPGLASVSAQVFRGSSARTFHAMARQEWSPTEPVPRSNSGAAQRAGAARSALHLPRDQPASASVLL